MSGRLVYVATIVAMVGITGGTVMATLLTPSTVNQAASFYEGGNSGIPNYPVPTLAPGTNTVGACTSGTMTVTTGVGPSTTAIVLASSGSSGVCTSSDFAEIFTFNFALSNLSLRQTNLITITTEYGGATNVFTNSEQVLLTTPGAGGPFVATLNVYVDYGAVNPPSGGIAVLDLVVG